jgi:Ala-tRNA(Pro) deacylase
MEYHMITKHIIDQLKNANVWFESFEHEEVKTSEEASKVRSGYTLHQGAKAMIVRVKKSDSDKKFIMLVLPGDLRFNSAKVKLLYSAKDIRFATEDEISTLTDGVQPGGVPPFGNLFHLEIVVDPSLLANEKIIFNAGDRRFSIAMRSSDYSKIVKPRIESIV